MKSKRNKIELNRIIIGSLLSSNLSPNEIKSFAIDLINNNNANRDLGTLLLECINKFSDPIEFPVDIESEYPSNNWVKNALEIIENNKISKAYLIKYIAEKKLTPLAKSTLEKNSIRSILEKVLYYITKEEAGALINDLLYVKNDPYLSGIDKNRN